MKNKIQDLRDHMFAALERLNDENLTPEALQLEISRCKALQNIGTVIVKSAKVEVDFLKVTGTDGVGSGFIPQDDVKRLNG